MAPHHAAIVEQPKAPGNSFASGKFLHHDGAHTAAPDGQSFLAAAAQRTGVLPSWQFLREGKPADQSLAAAREWQADVIVIGMHGRSGISRVLLRSTAESVVRHASCLVLVIKPHA